MNIENCEVKIGWFSWIVVPCAESHVMFEVK